MSAYQCSSEHIAAIAGLLTAELDTFGPISRKGDAMTSEDHYRAVFRLLWEENERSIIHRYCERSAGAPAAPANPFRSPAALKAFLARADASARIAHSCACYEHQSSEHPEWISSDARTLIGALVMWAARRGVERDTLPWGSMLEGLNKSVTLVVTTEFQGSHEIPLEVFRANWRTHDRMQAAINHAVSIGTSEVEMPQGVMFIRVKK